MGKAVGREAGYVTESSTEVKNRLHAVMRQEQSMGTTLPLNLSFRLASERNSQLPVTL